MIPRRALLGSAAAALAASLAACAPFPAHAAGRLVDLQVIDRAGGGTLPVWRGHGQDWIAGRPGDRYAVRLVNRTGERVLVVLSVDGVNAVSGETASTGQTGYVLAPWQSAEITGWRKSWQEAAAFYFTALPDSYAARTDRPDHVGVIGAAVFHERAPSPPPPVAWAPRRDAPGELSQNESRRGPAASADAAARQAPPPPPAPSEAPSARVAEPGGAEARERAASLAKAERSERLGTGHGERVWSPTQQTTFERASSRPDEVVQLRYDSQANLMAAGIVPRPRPQPRPFPQPQPFPGFAPDPRG